MFSFLKGVDNPHIEAGRVLWVLTSMCGLIYSGLHLYFNKEFSIIEFGTGMGAILALGAGGIAAKDFGVAKAKQTNQDTANAASQ